MKDTIWRFGSERLTEILPQVKITEKGKIRRSRPKAEMTIKEAKKVIRMDALLTNGELGRFFTGKRDAVMGQQLAKLAEERLCKADINEICPAPTKELFDETYSEDGKFKDE